MSAKAHVLIVEDEPVTRAKLAAYLTAEGFQVSEAADARDMKAIVAKTIPDVVLLDINLPDESGLILARELRAKSSVGIILVTARKESTRAVTEGQLTGLGIAWDQLIMGLTSGERYLINDKLEPDDRDRAVAVNVITDGGFESVDWEGMGL